jgi:hypothetical protein
LVGSGATTENEIKSVPVVTVPESDSNMTSNLDLIPRADLWAAVFGASVARYCHDYMAEGRGSPEDDVLDRFCEESEAIADMTLETLERMENEE